MRRSSLPCLLTALTAYFARKKTLLDVTRLTRSSHTWDMTLLLLFFSLGVLINFLLSSPLAITFFNFDLGGLLTFFLYFWNCVLRRLCKKKLRKEWYLLGFLPFGLTCVYLFQPLAFSTAHELLLLFLHITHSPFTTAASLIAIFFPVIYLFFASLERTLHTSAFRLSFLCTWVVSIIFFLLICY